MNRRLLYAVGIVLVVLAFGAAQVAAQGALTLESLAERIDKQDAHIAQLLRRTSQLEFKVSQLQRAIPPTKTPTPRPTRKPTATPKPTATLSPAFQAALDESAANEWANQALRQLSREKGRQGGWYERRNIVKVFLFVLDRCDLTGEELIDQIEEYERDRTVIAMNKEYEPNLTNEMAIFRDYNRAAGNNVKPCSKLVEQFKGLYKKEQEK